MIIAASNGMAFELSATTDQGFSRIDELLASL